MRENQESSIRTLPTGRMLPPRPPARSSVIRDASQASALQPKRQRRPPQCRMCLSPDHSSQSHPLPQALRGSIPCLVLAGNLIQVFKVLSSANTLMKTETGGLMFGHEEGGRILDDKLVIQSRREEVTPGRLLMKQSILRSQ